MSSTFYIFILSIYAINFKILAAANNPDIEKIINPKINPIR
jgi:hypothetical protein